MKIGELRAAFAAAVTTAFAGTDWAVWATPPDTTALPAVWVEFGTSHGGGNPRTGAEVTIRVVAAVAPKPTAAHWAAIDDAHDRCDTITVAPTAMVSRDAFVDRVEIGGVEHAALVYAFTIDRPQPC